MSFGMYLLAIFIPPLYLLIRKRWIAAIVNGTFYLLSLPLLFVFGVGIFLWFFCALQVVWDLRATIREREMQRQAHLMAEKMRETPSN